MQFPHFTFQSLASQYDGFCARCSPIYDESDSSSPEQSACAADGTQGGTITYTDAGLVQANNEDQGVLTNGDGDSATLTTGFIQTDAKDQCSSQYPDVCGACASSNSANGQSHDGRRFYSLDSSYRTVPDGVGGSCFACPAGQFYTAHKANMGGNDGLEEGCHAPAAPPPPQSSSTARGWSSGSEGLFFLAVMLASCS